MADNFLTRALSKLFGSRETAAGIIIGAFGKHPGYPEHFEDLDGEAVLSKLREMLYTHGVQAAVDRGVWKDLRESGTALPFRHTLIWRRDNAIVVGRMIASRDKLGRDRYPLMVIAVCPGFSVGGTLEFALTRVLPWVEQITQDCVAAADLPKVKEVIRRARESSLMMPDASPGSASDDPDTDSAVATAFLARCSDLEDHAIGLVNILYQIDREMGGFAPVNASSTNSRSRSSVQHSAHIRVPRCSSSTVEGIAAWLRFLRAYIADGVPVLLFIPDTDQSDEAWIDIIVGIPTEVEFFCLRSSSETMPFTSKIPYTIPLEFSTLARDRISQFLRKFPLPIEVLKDLPAGSTSRFGL